MTSPPPLPVLRQLLNEASAAPWACNDEPLTWVGGREGQVWSVPLRETGEFSDEVADTCEHSDAALIVALRNAAPALLDLVERQAAAIEAVQELAAELESEAQTREEIADHHPAAGAWDVDRYALRNGARRQRESAKRIRNCLSGITPTTEENPK